MSRSVGVVVVVCLALLAPSSAAAYSTGPYKGKQSQNGGTPLAFSVVAKTTHKGKKKVVKHYVRLKGHFTRIDANCPDGFVYHVNLVIAKATDIPIKGNKFALSEQVKFSGSFAGDGSKSHASGQVSFAYPNVTAHGGDCTSGKVGWSAHR
ncbi:MAG: hypothetical protein QOI45_1991 [Thermoleophilaceae bacterium]|nr:hypothetical protein [Thermoleophilaceae bacterium]